MLKTSNRSRHGSEPVAAPEPPTRVGEHRAGALRAPAAPAELVLQMQRLHGNQAVVQALGRAAGPVLSRAEITTESSATDGAAKFEEAVKAGEWRTAAMSLWALRDAEVQHLLDPLSDNELADLEAAAASSDLINQIFPGLAAKVHRHVSFQRNAPDQSDNGRRGTVTDRGTLEHEGGVGADGEDGTVKVRTGTDFANPDGREFEDGFSLKFKGKDASESSWLQFIWREIEVDDPVRGHLRLADPAQTRNGALYHLTTDPARPNYNVDSEDAANPFYEASNINNRTGEATTIFDAPGSGEHLVQREFALGATSVISRAHFTTYLVREMDVLYAVNIDVEWEYVNANIPPRTQNVSGAGNVAALDPAMRKRLLYQYPAIDYLP